MVKENQLKVAKKVLMTPDELLFGLSGGLSKKEASEIVHNNFLKQFKEKRNLKKLFREYKQLGLISSDVLYHEWYEYMENELSVRKLD